MGANEHVYNGSIARDLIDPEGLNFWESFTQPLGIPSLPHTSVDPNQLMECGPVLIWIQSQPASTQLVLVLGITKYLGWISQPNPSWAQTLLQLNAQLYAG